MASQIHEVPTKIGNGAKASTKAIGDLPFKTANGKVGNMGGVHLIPGAPFNLASGTNLLANGWSLVGDQDKWSSVS